MPRFLVDRGPDPINSVGKSSIPPPPLDIDAIDYSIEHHYSFAASLRSPRYRPSSLLELGSRYFAHDSDLQSAICGYNVEGNF